VTGTREGFIVRVLHAGSGAAVGIGFVIDDRHLVTCAHVVNTALGRARRATEPPPDNARVHVEFPLLGDGDGAPVRTCRVAAWAPPSMTGFTGADIAGLVLTGEGLPAGAGPARMIDNFEPGSADVEVFGYPGNPPRKETGAWAVCRLRSGVGTGLIQLDSASESALRAQPGYSGSPAIVRDSEGDAVVGMVAVASGDGSAQDAYANPLRRLVQAWPEVVGPLILPPCPYRGLQVFTADDAASGVFVGRQAEVDQLHDLVRRRPALVLTGPSGVGKSSLVAAGLAPRLAAEGWQMVTVRTAGMPMESLARALLEAEQPGERIRMYDLLDRRREIEVHGLWPIAERVALLRGRPLVICLDQFEEVLTEDQDEQVLAGFLDRVLPPSPERTASSKVRLLCVLRADFLPRLLDVPGIGQRMQTDLVPLFPLSPMSRPALERVIREPAAVYGVAYESGLTEVIAKDASRGRGSLPLLEFTLTQLWSKQRQRLIGFADYHALGGVPGALNRYAEAVLTALSESIPPADVRRTLLRMVRSRSGSTDATRVTVPREQLGDDWHVVQEIAQRRLVVVDSERTIGDTETAEIAHESLIREWDRLRTWVDEDAEFQHWLVTMEERAAEGDLLSEGRIADADRWLIERREDVPDTVTHLIEQSRTTIRHRIEELERMRQQSEEAARRAEEAARQAVRAAREAEARRLAAAAELAMSSNQPQPVFLALAIESMRTLPTLEGDIAIRHAISLAPRIRTNIPHEDAVTSVAFSPDGSRVATASWDGTARVRDLATGAELLRVRHEGAVSAVAFSPDGTRLASAGDDGSARMSDISTGAELFRVVHEGAVKAIAFSGDGRWIASGADDGRTRVVDADTGREALCIAHQDEVNGVAFDAGGALVALASAEGYVRVVDTGSRVERFRVAHDEPANDVVFSPDGRLVATASDDGSARVVTVADGVERFRVSHEDAVNAVTFSPDGQLLATASDDGSVRIVQAADGSAVARAMHQDAVLAVAFSPDGRRIASAGAQRIALVIDVETGQEVCRTTHDGAVNAVAFSPDGGLVATASWDNTSHVVAARSGPELLLAAHHPAATGAVFSPTGATVATCGEDGVARVLDPGTGAALTIVRHDGPVYTISYTADGERLASAGADGLVRITSVARGGESVVAQHGGAVYAAVFSPDGAHLATAGADGITAVFDAASGQPVSRVDHGAPVRAVAFSPDGTLLASGGWGDTVYVTDAATGAEVSRVKHDGPIRTVCFSPDGSRLAIGSWDRTARVVDVATGRQLACVVHENPVNACAWAPDGRRIATASDDGTVRVVDVHTNTEVLRAAQDDEVNAVVFSPDGARIATASDDGTVRVLSATTSMELARGRHGDEVRTVAFSPDGSCVVTASADGTARIWSLRVDVLLAQALARLSRDLTVSEWPRYFRNEHWRPIRTP
jgi:WD40 repeat protein